MGIYDVPKSELIEKTAVALKQQVKEVKPPVWADFVKTGASKERPPANADWWFVRAASVLSQIHRLGPVGVAKLRTHYGGRKNNGAAPESFFKASGNIIRKVLQQLEKAGLAKQAKKGQHKGRILTPKGASLLEKVSSAIMKEKGITLPARPKDQELQIQEEKKTPLPRKKKATEAVAE